MHYGDALAGKILIDITNPFNADASGLVTTAGNSVSQRMAAAAPEGTHVVKAFNTIVGGVLAAEKPLDAFFAGDNAPAKTRVAEFLASLDMRPLDAGGLEMTHALEWAGILTGSSWSAWPATAPVSTSPWVRTSTEGSFSVWAAAC